MIDVERKYHERLAEKSYSTETHKSNDPPILRSVTVPNGHSYFRQEGEIRC
jgi:hypothetical protein